MAFDIDMIKAVYGKLEERVKLARKLTNKPLTLSEKILYTHLWDEKATTPFKRGTDYVDFAPDRIACQDATAQMALLQFMQAGKKQVAVPTTVHCDHLIQAKNGASSDLQAALNNSNEVFNFLESVSNKYGIGFWKPGAGIIHQVVLENYAFPGGMMIGTDSHTVNAGGLGMVAIGVGGADAVDVMAGMPWELKFPKLIGVKLTGKLSGWTAPKDVILKVAGIVSAKGGTGAIVEYFGEGAIGMSCTGKGTICNMGAEIGATTSTFGYDKSMERYLRATDRGDVADAANLVKEHLTGDPQVYENPEKYFDQVIEINLSELDPLINGPFTPDLSTKIGGDMTEKATENQWPLKVEWGLIGSCTNSSYEDLSRASSIAQQAIDKGLKTKADFGINPGSEKVRYTADRDGILGIFEKLDATIFTNACGPCIGQWARYEDPKNAPKNSIIHSFNRNFAKRADGNPNTHAFVASPEMVAAITIAGRLDFNPITDFLINENGEEVMLDEPTGWELPPKGFEVKDDGYLAPTEDGSNIEIKVNPKSNRLELLIPFTPLGNNITGAKLLIKAFGKCTTDHISMAGPWLRYRGHLDNISNNCLIGAVNAFGKKTNFIKNQLDGQFGAVPDVARKYKAADVKTIVVGDHNYGEGSSREHAAMEPRHLGVAAVIVKSFARIHETNLKKQGMLGLTFSEESDYDLIQEDDTFNFLDLNEFTPAKQLTIEIVHADNSKDIIKVNHTYNKGQIAWYNEGSALNLIKKENA
ncbi:aconitate hydratase [Tenacibaculum finnmarkense genomovar finnmarkense]|uniref:aconitate hydratase n=1 Tax=Tenacibaculum finnmarkense TaxID=2781243 RepID=UPI001E2CA303|nr:aconitate hydratase [Tenacibaculum finnmarkense]MCD8417546.1 aconitate hydratase [Tenacibaculum finnmarkense genomovar finnmarkense]MCG8186016.1 aconitate hydratase [Tenacibaculum finnmarkense genomovar finnmarkense]MCG8202484.1 aconitate hydratase [Tenacibaculum finnmarkense genomovar finnmarkense]MCG8209857.1 aconitate hydratase [Tenacibaculum finnmarkense genomovar finnmarkense]MCG8212685.1 aconitate hydratase [Tenacibaculum finnmarkense genomovar finnmarkense]